MNDRIRGVKKANHLPVPLDVIFNSDDSAARALGVGSGKVYVVAAGVASPTAQNQTSGSRAARLGWEASALLAVIMLSALTSGCKAFAAKHDNPVMANPPRRVSLEEPPDPEELRRKRSKVALAGLEKTDDELLAGLPNPEDFPVDEDAPPLDFDLETAILNAKVVAKVNGYPVFAGEVLEPYGEYLRVVHEKMLAQDAPPEEFIKLRDHLIRKDLRTHLIRRLAVEMIRGKLKKEQLKQLDEHIDRDWERELVQLKAQLGVGTKPELEDELNKRGTSIAELKSSFASRLLAQQYVAGKLGKHANITRPQMLAYYKEHIEDYTFPEKVKWQEIRVNFQRPVDQINLNVDGKLAARDLLQTIRSELKEGVEFDEIAKQYSDGPTAADGGIWDWTTRGSLSDAELEDAIFGIPEGVVSEPITTKTGFHIVKVIRHRKGGQKPFEEVQAEIQERIERDRIGNRPQKIAEKLLDTATVETEYDYLGAPPKKKR